VSIKATQYISKLAAKNRGQTPFKMVANLPFGGLN